MQQSEFRDLALAEFRDVYRMALSLARDPTDAADLTPETYVGTAADLARDVN